MKGFFDWHFKEKRKYYSMTFMDTPHDEKAMKTILDLIDDKLANGMYFPIELIRFLRRLAD